MSGNFEYIAIILLAMIAGFIFLRLKNILGRKTGHQGKSNFGRFGGANDSIHHDHEKNKINSSDNFDPNAKNFFLNGAKIAYETIIVAFAKGDKKTLKSLLNRDMYEKFARVIEEKNKKQIKSETTFIGIKSADIKEFKKDDSIYKVTVGFTSEIIACDRDKENNIVTGNPDIIKTVKDVWKFSKNMWSDDPTWYLVETLN